MRNKSYAFLIFPLFYWEFLKGRAVKYNETLELFEMGFETKFDGESACLQACNPHVAYDGEIEYSVSLVGANHDYGNVAIKVYYLISYVLVATLLKWSKIKAILLHVWRFMSWKSMYSSW